MSESALARAHPNPYRDLFLRHPQPMWVFDLETLRFLDVNEAATAVYGYSRDEFLAMTTSDIRPEGDRAFHKSFVAQLIDARDTSPTADRTIIDSGVRRRPVSVSPVSSLASAAIRGSSRGGSPRP